MGRHGKWGWLWAVSIVTALAASLASAETKRVESRDRLVELVTEAAGAADVDWEARDPVGASMKTFRCTDGTTRAVIWVSGPGAVVVSDVIDWDARQRIKTQWIVTIVGSDPPPAPGPSPPPAPGPSPPAPDAAPFPAPGLTVVIVGEFSDDNAVRSMPASQLAIFNSAQVLRWCVEHCFRHGNSDIAFRRWDDDYTDTDLHVVPPFLKQAYVTTKQARKNEPEPWIGISDGKTGYIGPLPKDIAGTLELLGQYGGK